jgi:lysophospholipase L1-like esterase
MVSGAVLALGCGGGAGPTLVACVGDSITVGDGASSPKETYPAALQAMLGQNVAVHGFGHSATTVLGPGAGPLPYETQPEYGEATTVVAQAGRHASIAVVILLGTNDSRPPAWDAPGRRERFVADYERLVDHFASLPTHPTVYLATPLGTGPHPCCDIRGEVLDTQITPLVRQIAAKHGLSVIDTTRIGRDPALLVDDVHPNDKGYEELAAIVKESLLAHPPKPQDGASWWSRFR